MKPILYRGSFRIECAGFVAGAEYSSGRVTRTDPILSWMRGRLVSECLRTIRRYRPEAVIYVINER